MTNTITLGEVAFVAMGSAPPGNTYNDIGKGLPMIAGAGDYGEKYPEPKKWTTAPSRVTEIGDLIVCVRATIGNLNWADKKYCLGRGVAGLRAKKSKLDINYAAHYINAKKHDLEKLGTGSTFLAIRRADLENFPIPLPPLSEQKRIAVILDKVDAIRRKRQQAIKLADDFLHATFLDMFGDPVTNPKRWKTILLGDLIADGPQNGLYRPAKDYGKGTPILRIDSFYDGQVVNLTDLKRVRINAATVDTYKLLVNDIVINRVNSRKYLGKSALITELYETTIFESNIMRLSINNERVSTGYLIDYMQQNYTKRQILSKSRDAVNQSSINQQDVKSLEIRLPPMDLQKNYVETVKKSKKLFVHIEEFKGISTQLFNSLTQRAFRGEL
jgi:type I restriction enzyme, S subunit